MIFKDVVLGGDPVKRIMRKAYKKANQQGFEGKFRDAWRKRNEGLDYLGEKYEEEHPYLDTDEMLRFELEQYQQKGEVNPFVTDNKREYEKRRQAYADSLFANNYYNEYFRLKNQGTDYGRIRPWENPQAFEDLLKFTGKYHTFGNYNPKEVRTAGIASVDPFVANSYGIPQGDVTIYTENDGYPSMKPKRPIQYERTTGNSLATSADGVGIYYYADPKYSPAPVQQVVYQEKPKTYNYEISREAQLPNVTNAQILRQLLFHNNYNLNPVEGVDYTLDKNYKDVNTKITDQDIAAWNNTFGVEPYTKEMTEDEAKEMEKQGYTVKRMQEGGVTDEHSDEKKYFGEYLDPVIITPEPKPITYEDRLNFYKNFYPGYAYEQDNTAYNLPQFHLRTEPEEPIHRIWANQKPIFISSPKGNEKPVAKNQAKKDASIEKTKKEEENTEKNMALGLSLMTLPIGSATNPVLAPLLNMSGILSYNLGQNIIDKGNDYGKYLQAASYLPLGYNIGKTPLRSITSRKPIKQNKVLALPESSYDGVSYVVKERYQPGLPDIGRPVADWEKRVQNFYEKDVNQRLRKMYTDELLFFDKGEIMPPLEVVEPQGKSWWAGFARGADEPVRLVNWEGHLDDSYVHEGAHIGQFQRNKKFGTYSDRQQTDKNTELGEFILGKGYGYSKKAQDLLDDAYQFTYDFLKEKEGSLLPILEKGASNREMRYYISRQHNDKTGKELDNIIDNISDDELELILNGENGYTRDFLKSINKRVKEGKTTKEEAYKKIREALKGVAYNNTEYNNNTAAYGGQFQEGGPLDPEEYLKSYLDSPAFADKFVTQWNKELTPYGITRVGKTDYWGTPKFEYKAYNDPLFEVKDIMRRSLENRNRMLNSNVRVNYDKSVKDNWGIYNPYYHSVRYYYQDVLPHELGHAYDVYNFHNINEESSPIFGSYPHLFNQINEKKNKNTEYYDEEHDKKPSETYADLMSVRYWLYKNGIFDSREKNKINDEQIEQARKKINESKIDRTQKRFFNQFNNEQIKNLINEIAYKEQKVNIAQNGGPIENVPTVDLPTATVTGKPSFLSPGWWNKQADKLDKFALAEGFVPVVGDAASFLADVGANFARYQYDKNDPTLPEWQRKEIANANLKSGLGLAGAGALMGLGTIGSFPSGGIKRIEEEYAKEIAKGPKHWNEKKLKQLRKEHFKLSTPENKTNDYTKSTEPIEFYHGSPNKKFTSFRENGTNNVYWFSPHKDFASKYGTPRSFYLNSDNYLGPNDIQSSWTNKNITNTSHSASLGDFSNKTTEYIVGNRNNIKLSDAVTYDNKGNIIPLSKRDDFSKKDIRYGIIPPTLLIGTGTAAYNRFNQKDKEKQLKFEKGGPLSRYGSCR